MNLRDWIRQHTTLHKVVHATWCKAVAPFDSRRAVSSTGGGGQSPPPPPATYTLTVQINGTGGTGTITPSAGAHTYPAGMVVQCEAVPDSYHNFFDWLLDGNLLSTNLTCSLTMNSDHVLTAEWSAPGHDRPHPPPPPGGSLAVYYPYGLPVSVTITMMDGSIQTGTLLQFATAQAINYGDYVALWSIPIAGLVNPAVPVPEVPGYNVWDWDRTNKFFGSASPQNLNAPLLYPAGSV